MKKRMTKNAILAGAALLALPAGVALLSAPATVTASGIVGQCADCHTMHNSEQGQAVAQLGLAGDTTITPIQNLLRYDCVACHAHVEASGPTHSLPGGSVVPQVSHNAGTQGDLFADNTAAGNFRFLDDGNRKGHNVRDLYPGGDADYLAVDNMGGTADAMGSAGYYGSPPGKYYASQDGHRMFTSEGGTPFDMFTCAGAQGCHGTRSNLLANDSSDTTGGSAVRRQGIAAVSGAHHNSFDGLKNPDEVTTVNFSGHQGTKLAESYRFLLGVKGQGNETNRWQNLSATSHNEYFGAATGAYPAGCNSCHVPGDGDAEGAVSKRMTFDSTLKAPNQSMSGFCATCHGNFHSSGNEDPERTQYAGGPYNGTSGAFLRHPSDYVIPNASEYADYTVYDLTAPVARDVLDGSVGGAVAPGTDMVMCLSCHMAHASPNDGMLRFDYAQIVAGSNDTTAGGCLACHTTKATPGLTP